MCSSSLAVCIVEIESVFYEFVMRALRAWWAKEEKVSEKRKSRRKRNEPIKKSPNTKNGLLLTHQYYSSKLVALHLFSFSCLFSNTFSHRRYRAHSPRRCDCCCCCEFECALPHASVHTINKFVIVVVVDTTIDFNETKWKWWFFSSLVCLLFGSDRESIIILVYACMLACLRLCVCVGWEKFILLQRTGKNRFEWEWDWKRSQIAIEQIKIYLQFEQHNASWTANSSQLFTCLLVCL